MADEEAPRSPEAHTRVRPRTSSIRGFILENVSAHPGDIARVTASEFGVTRTAINRHVRKLVADGILEAEGATRARQYRLRKLESHVARIAVSPDLQEDRVWTTEVSGHLERAPQNVREICQYGFTEMLNNVIDHSGSEDAVISVEVTARDVDLTVRDFGIGIFRKIYTELALDDEEHAILELAKGKLTTDPDRHSGEGIFFTSRMFDSFSILSGRLYFGSERGDDWLLPDRKPTIGTIVFMRVALDSKETVKSVFDRFTTDFESYGFSRTHIPVRLVRHEGERLVSRSQAKRLLVRVDQFQEVILDFEEIEEVGQAFSDEIFRVFARQHPEVHLSAINVSGNVQRMIDRALSARKA